MCLGTPVVCPAFPGWQCPGSARHNLLRSTPCCSHGGDSTYYYPQQHKRGIADRGWAWGPGGDRREARGEPIESASRFSPGRWLATCRDLLLAAPWATTAEPNPNRFSPGRWPYPPEWRRRANEHKSIEFLGVVREITRGDRFQIDPEGWEQTGEKNACTDPVHSGASKSAAPTLDLTPAPPPRQGSVKRAASGRGWSSAP